MLEAAVHIRTQDWELCLVSQGVNAAINSNKKIALNDYSKYHFVNFRR